jgi:peptidoglycan/LPS O-acetylase OafA/YrhL
VSNGAPAGPNDTRRGPSLHPTRPATLLVAGLAAAAAGWLIIANDYGDFPTIQWLPAVIFVGLAALEMIAAISTRARIERKPGAGPVEPLTVMRYAVLAKASSLAAAIFVGLFAAISAWLLASRNLQQARNDTPAALGALLGAILLLAAALLLERACRVPPRSEDEDEDQTEDK